MGEDLVGQEEARRAAWHRAAGAGQMVELAEGPGECRLAALVRPGDDEDPFGVAQVKFVADHWRAHGDQLGRERQVKGVASKDLLGVSGELRKAEAEPGRAHRFDVVQVCQVELEITLELPDRRVKERGVPSAVIAERGELLAEQASHQIDDLGADMAHARRAPVLDPVVLHRALLESLECLLNLGAVVSLAVVAAYLHPQALDPDLVHDLGKVVLAVRGVGGKPGEFGGGDVGGQEVTERQQATRGDRPGGKVAGQ